MFSTRCAQCKQPITLKTDEIREAVAEAESAGHTHYNMNCPKCRKPVKIAVNDLKRKLPADTAPTDATPAE